MATIKIEILNTGSELLLGSTANTHGTWMGQQLMKLGLRVQRQTTVPDGEAITVALREAVRRSDVVIVTGGLGPTSDDITREAAAEVLGVELVRDEAALRSLEDFFRKRNKPMAPVNVKQADILVGADVLPNPNGTAPGIYAPPRLGCALFLLPGPPRELYPMWHAEVVPRLKALSGIEVIPEVQELRFTGLGESELHDQIDEELAAIEGLEVGYCARLGEVDLRLIGQPEVIRKGRDLAVRKFASCLVSEGGESLEEVVVGLLQKRAMKLSTVESCTGGLIASRLTDISGASEVFEYGFVTYSNGSKIDLVKVDETSLAEFGAVSEQVAGEMAAGGMVEAEADICIAVTGIAGPTGGSDAKPVGRVCFGIATEKGVVTVSEDHPRSRTDFKRQVSQRALDLVRRVLIEGTGSPLLEELDSQALHD